MRNAARHDEGVPPDPGPDALEQATALAARRAREFSDAVEVLRVLERRIAAGLPEGPAFRVLARDAAQGVGVGSMRAAELAKALRAVTAAMEGGAFDTAAREATLAAGVALGEARERARARAASVPRPRRASAGRQHPLMLVVQGRTAAADLG